MSEIKTYIAVRDPHLENRLFAIARAAHYAVSPVTRDAIVNDCRSFEPVFVVEETFRSILRLIEFHNSCLFNFLPSIVLTKDRALFSPEVPFRFPYKYVVIERNLAIDLLTDLVSLLNELRRGKHQEHLLKVYRSVGETALRPDYTVADVLSCALREICDLVFGSLVVAASTRREIVGIEVPENAASPAWYAFKSGEPLFCEDIARDARFTRKEGVYAKDYFLIVPIRCGGRTIGVLNLTDKMVSLLFDRADLVRVRGFLRLLAPLLAAARAAGCR